MNNTDNLQLPYITPSQAQKHVTHNEALRSLDAVVQLSVANRTPLPEATSSWRRRRAPGQAGMAMSPPGGRGLGVLRAAAGWLAWIADESALFFWTGADW